MLCVLMRCRSGQWQYSLSFSGNSQMQTHILSCLEEMDHKKNIWLDAMRIKTSFFQRKQPSIPSRIASDFWSMLTFIFKIRFAWRNYYDLGYVGKKLRKNVKNKIQLNTIPVDNQSNCQIKLNSIKSNQIVNIKSDLKPELDNVHCLAISDTER